MTDGVTCTPEMEDPKGPILRMVPNPHPAFYNSEATGPPTKMRGRCYNPPRWGSASWPPSHAVEIISRARVSSRCFASPFETTFNTNAIVYDNTPWRPGRDIDLAEKSEEDERKLNNLATRIMSNGVEVLVKDKKSDGKQEQRNLKHIHASSLPLHQDSSTPSKQLLSSAVATVVSRQQISALFPLHQLMQHNYIIKTCMTTYTYLTTVVQNKRSAISTFETIVSVVTTESLTNLYDTDIIPDLQPTKTKYMEVKTIQPSASANLYMNNYPKIDKRIDSDEDDNFDLIQPSEVSTPCTSLCTCSHTNTEGLQTQYTNIDLSASTSRYGIKSTEYGTTKLNLRPTNKESGPYEYETNTPLAPTDKLVEKYTEVMNDYSEEKDTSSVEESDLLTNEQAPTPVKTNKINTKNPEKTKPDKQQKPNKNKFVVAELIKLGSLGIKGLSQLAPVIEKMTGGLIKRQDTINKTTTTTIKPAVQLTPYKVNKRIDSDLESKHSSFPIYIPVDEMETSESQMIFTNATLHQNLVWAAEHKQPKSHIVPPKFMYESPLVNGGIPISPGEIITANSDVIVGKPAVGGPLTLAASGINLQNPVNPPHVDSFVAANEQYLINEKPINDQLYDQNIQIDDSFDLRPPQLPNTKVKATRPNIRPSLSFNKQNIPKDKYPYRMPSGIHDHLMKTEQIKTTSMILGNHGRPAFLDYIPSLAKPTSSSIVKHHINFTPASENNKETDIADNSPSSSEVVNTKIKTEAEYTIASNTELNKQFLVDIQPSKVANVLIPHGSSTALVFAGSSEPHKTGDYVDDPLPYPEPGYFGSFSIDAPQMTNVHNVAPNNNKQLIKEPNPPSVLESYKPNFSLFKEQHSVRNDLKFKWKDSKRPFDYKNIPPPTSNQETHLQVGPQITAYNPNLYHPTGYDFNKPNQTFGKEKQKTVKEVIDKEYENYLAVPPPPPHKYNYNLDIYDNNKAYNQKPIVHIKPVQDMKVFLNIQHPVPDQLPPKITSEVYFAAQMPNSKPTPTYTIHMPPASPPHKYNQGANNQPPKSVDIEEHIHNSFSAISLPNIRNNSIIRNKNNDKNNTYAVTLNTATNVASNSETGQVIGSSVSVPVDISSNTGLLNTNIPIGTNFAIRVEDNDSELKTYNIQGNGFSTIVYNDHGHVPQTSETASDNRWNMSSADQTENKVTGSNYDNKNYYDKFVKDSINPSIPPYLNSHANFPIINEYNIPTNVEKLKPVTEYIDDTISVSTKRPGISIPNTPTNSHGWYSSVINEKNLNNIHIQTTTRKIIPLFHYEKDSLPQFGQKIATVGKPPTEFLPPNIPSISKLNIGKPFTKTPTTENPYTTVSFTKQPFKINYIPSNLGTINQPAYDIPIRDNSDETTTAKFKERSTTEKLKTVYENSEEIYDGEEETENIGDLDGEVSSESMKIPVVSASVEIENDYKSSTERTLPQKEISKQQEKDKTDKNKDISNMNPGTQTEKPFGILLNHTDFTTNTIKPFYDKYSYMKPRPFTVNTAMVLDHQLQQPHWQINQMMENSTNISYEDNLDLNIGEEMKVPYITKATSTPNPYTTPFDMKFKKTTRPIFTNQFNNSHVHNESIITSTVHIQDKKPLIVEKASENTALPSFTLSAIEINRTSSEIIDLSPPPPTLDYNFKPSTNDEIIMGMSPPPPRPPGIRLPPRVPITPRPVLPVRTSLPYRTKQPRPSISMVTSQRPIRKPVTRDEVSTFKPTYNILNNIRRPIYNHDQPSSQLLPPPKDIPSRVTKPAIELSSSPINIHEVPNIVFPTPISSGWLTSSGIEFSSSFNFAPTSVQFPKMPKPSIKQSSDEITSSENSYSYEVELSSEHIEEISSEIPKTQDQFTISNESSTESATSIEIPISEINDSTTKFHQDDVLNIDKMKIVPIVSKTRTRKPYPVRNDGKTTTTSKYTLNLKPTSMIKPTRTITRPEILYPIRPSSTKMIVRPFIRPSLSTPLNILESSESSMEEEFIHPTEVLKENVSITRTQSQTEPVDSVQKEPSVTVSASIEDLPIIELITTHHAGNEVKIIDEIIPTKTEFLTTIITLTKTLSEPPKTISSIGYVNLTHTLTVTHTKTSLISQSEGAITQTLVLTNTQTSTRVDIVTEILTQVQPTTIIETVTKHIPILQVQPSPVQETVPKTKEPLDDISMSSEENENLIIKNNINANIIQKIDNESESDNDTFFVVMNKSQNGGQAPSVHTDIETGDYEGVTRNEQVNSNGVSQVLFGEILLAGAPFLDTSNVNTNVIGYGKECQPDCKASRNERCQRIDRIMKCICRPGFARMFPDRPCKPTYTYSVKLALGTHANERLEYQDSLSNNSSKQYHALAVATYEGINRMVMQSDLRDVFHGVHITGFHPVEMRGPGGDLYQGVINDFYVQLSDNAHENRLKEVIEKYLRNNNYSLGGTEVHAASELLDKLEVSDFDECSSGQFHDCSEHAQCFNLRGTYTCSCLEGFADLSVNNLYPGRICSAEQVGCERCNYHGACYSRDDRRVLCECFQWYSGSSCQINLKVVLISLVVCGALLSVVLAVCAVLACSKRRPPQPQRSIVACIQSMPSLHQGGMPKQRADRRALISERGESGDASSMQNVSLPYIPTKRTSTSGKKLIMSDPPAHDPPPPPPAPAVMIPRARLHAHHGDSRENIARKRSLEMSSEAKLISYLESGATTANDEMRRKHSLESSYSANKDRHNKQGALVSAGFKVSTTVRPDESNMKDERDDLSSVNKGDLEAELARFDTLRKSYSQEELSEWTDAERRLGELTLSEARSVGGTLPASTGRAASSTRLTNQEANTMAERDLGSTFLLPHVHLYKSDLTSDVSEFDSL